DPRADRLRRERHQRQRVPEGGRTTHRGARRLARGGPAGPAAHRTARRARRRARDLRSVLRRAKRGAARVTADRLFSVQDRVVVVTGGLGRLGRRFASALVERGARVAIFDVGVDRPRPGGWTAERVMVVEADVTAKASLEAALAQVTSAWEVPFGLVNNAALDSPPQAPIEENGPFESYPESSWDRVMEVNVKGVFLTSQVVAGPWPGRGAARS